jgi:hypothetical protein
MFRVSFSQSFRRRIQCCLCLRFFFSIKINFHNDQNTFFIVPTDAHYYNYHRMLKQFKIITLAPTCFGSRRNHHQGAVLCLAKTTNCGFSVLDGIDVVNVMAAYQPVVQACGSPHACTTDWYANGRQHIRCFIPQAVFYSLMLLKMGINIARNMSS